MAPGSPESKGLEGKTSRMDACNSTVEFRPTVMDSHFFITSLFLQLLDLWRNPVPNAPKGSPAELPVTDMRPWFRELPSQLSMLYARPVPQAMDVTSKPIAVRDIWQDYRWKPASLANSILLHGLAVIMLVVPYALVRPRKTGADFGTSQRIVFHAEEVPGLVAWLKAHDGKGGGGKESATPASKGILPPVSTTQIAPPSAMTPIIAPILSATPTIIGPPDLKMPKMDAQLHWGDPTGAPGAPSDGPGSGGGIGPGNGTGVGPDAGPGYGHGNTPGVYTPGRDGVTAPMPTYDPSPNYTEDARKAKLQGKVTLAFVVDAQGNPTNIRVVRSLGMGLDESAVATAKTWRFKPGTRNGVPIPVQVILDVFFRLF